MLLEAFGRGSPKARTPTAGSIGDIKTDWKGDQIKKLRVPPGVESAVPVKPMSRRKKITLSAIAKEATLGPMSAEKYQRLKELLKQKAVEEASNSTRKGAFT